MSSYTMEHPVLPPDIDDWDHQLDVMCVGCTQQLLGHNFVGGQCVGEAVCMMEEDSVVGACVSERGHRWCLCMREDMWKGKCAPPHVLPHAHMYSQLCLMVVVVVGGRSVCMAFLWQLALMFVFDVT